MNRIDLLKHLPIPIIGFRAAAQYWRDHYMPEINGLEARLSEATARIKQLEEQATDGRDK